MFATLQSPCPHAMHATRFARYSRKWRRVRSEEDVEYVPLQKGEQVGPGGLDPAEVFETLPKELQEAFGERDIEALKKCLSQMSTEDAQYHMKRCADSGLWNPAGGEDEDDSAEQPDGPSAEVDD